MTCATRLEVDVELAVALEPGGPAWSAAMLGLSSTEHERLAATALVDDRRRFLTGRSVLRRLAARRLGVVGADVEVSARCATCGGPHGPPRVRSRDGRTLRASVSHTEELVLVALTEGGPVGVDLVRQWDTAFDGFDDLVLSPAERRAPQPADRGRLRAWRSQVWAAKEAALKATGHGLRVPPGDVELSRPGTVAPGTATVRTPRGLLVLDVHGLDAPEGHRAALARLPTPGRRSE